jgi:hypothetical protein
MRFADALDRRGEEIERPPLVPVGTYLWTVAKIPEMDTIADGRFDIVDFQLRCIAAQDDVDPDALAEYSQKAGNIAGLTRRHRFLFNTEDEGAFNRTLFNMKRFVKEHLGIDDFDSIPLKEALARCVNAQCLASVRWRPDPKDAEIMYDEIDRTAPAN